MYEFLSNLLSDKDKGILTFEALSLCHILYLLLIFGGIALVLYLFRNKTIEAKHKLINFTIILALIIYIADFFLMPFSYGYIDIDKLPFHICTLMSIMCVLSRRTKVFSKFKTSFTLMGLVGALMYLIYPAGVAEADGYSYRIVQTVLYHGLMIAQGVFAIAYNDLDLNWKSIKYDLFAILGLTLWAMLGNTLYSGEVKEACNCVEGCTNLITVYEHDFNWFFVKHDALYIIPDDIDIYFAPFIMIVAIFGMCALVRFISLKLEKVFNVDKEHIKTV